MLGSHSVIHTGQAQIHHGWSGSAKENLGAGRGLRLGPAQKVAEKVRLRLPGLGGGTYSRELLVGGVKWGCILVFVTLNWAWLSLSLIFLFKERSDCSYYRR